MIKEKYDDFFIDCKVEPISEIGTFFEKINAFSEIHRIKADVNPPNPLFGHLWKSLKEYLERRSTQELKIEEKTENNEINTKIIELIKAIANKEDIKKIDENEIDIGDAAILMAIDGYGNGTIEGASNGKIIKIRTNEKVINFNLNKDPEPESLFKETKSRLENINKERYMEH